MAQSDLAAVARLRSQLWPDGTEVEHHEEAALTLQTGRSGTLPAAVFVAEDAEGRVVGFLDAGLRSHADGCDASIPVGYIEGWFVEEPCRGIGVGRALVAAAEDWARSQGCREMASDTWIDNEPSQHAHRALGYEEVDRCVNYRKEL